MPDAQHEAAIERIERVLHSIRKARAAYDAARSGDEPERLAAIEACDSVRELIVKFAKVGDKEAGEWLDRHLKTIRAALSLPVRAARSGEAEGCERVKPAQVREGDRIWDGEQDGWTVIRRIVWTDAEGGYFSFSAENERGRTYASSWVADRVVLRATSQHPEPRQDQPVDRASGETSDEEQAKDDAREAFSANIRHPDALAEFGDPQHAHTPEECFTQGWNAAAEHFRDEAMAPYHAQAASERQRSSEHPVTDEREAVTQDEVDAAMQIVKGDYPDDYRAVCGLCAWRGPTRATTQSATEDSREHGCFAYRARPPEPLQDGGEREPWTGKRLFDTMLHEAERARNPFGRLSSSGKVKWDALAARIEREIANAAGKRKWLVGCPYCHDNHWEDHVCIERKRAEHPETGK